MKSNDNQVSTAEEEAIIITLPATALETIGTPFGGQRSRGHGAAENSGSFMATATGRWQPFQCFKKSFEGDRLVVRITRERRILTET